MKKTIYSKRYKTLRSQLVKARKASGLTQYQLAKRLGKPQSFVAKYENGERRLDVIEFLTVAEELGANPLQMLIAII